MRLIKHCNVWPWGIDTTLISSDGLASVSVSDIGRNFGFIHDLMVHPSVRRRGRAKELLDAAEQEIVRTYRLRKAVLRVVPGTFVEQWYRRVGYRDYIGAPERMDGYIELIKEL